MTDLTNQQKAEQHRRIADAYDALADAFNVLDGVRPGTYVEAAELERREADRLDPPQPEWQDGDLVIDSLGNLWQYDESGWGSTSPGLNFRPTRRLVSDYGPLRKVRLADPAKREVVVSLDGLDREALIKGWADEDESDRYYASTVAIRAARAAREQLGEVQS